MSKVLLWSLFVGMMFNGRIAQAANDSAHDMLDIVLVVFGVLIVLLVIVYTIKYFVWPAETDARHIKRRILHDDW